jgi:tRNA(Ile)-lysidine synthase
VLLYAMAGLRDKGVDWSLSAVHVHHGLNAAADDWAQFCQDLCRRMQIPVELIHVDASPVRGESPEATARKLRYQAIAEIIREGDALLTAHHQDDQAETLLLQLMRGSGVPGLAAMPSQVSFSKGILLRPLLDFRRHDLREYALQQQLDWVEDSSNEDIRFDRNFMRHEILPELTGRWPGLVAKLCRTSMHMSEAMSLLDERAAEDLQQVVTAERSIININALGALSKARQHNLLRYWLRDLGLPVPSQAQMQHVISDVIHAAPGSDPCVKWPGVELRAYRRQLYALSAMSPFMPDRRLAWDMQSVLQIDGVGTLEASMVQGQGLTTALLGQKDICIGFRQGGERIRPARRGHEHELKKLFQEAAVPPWQRERTPILYQGDQVVAVAGLCESESFQAGEGQQGLLLHWHKHFG